jgi:hypothetical protein
MNWTALAAVLVLAVLAAVVWLALAARLVANEEKAKERAEAERRRLDLLRETVEAERRAPGASPAEPSSAAAGRRDAKRK